MVGHSVWKLVKKSHTLHTVGKHFWWKNYVSKAKKKFEMGSMKIRVTRNDTKNNNFAHCVEVGQINIVVT